MKKSGQNSNSSIEAKKEAVMRSAVEKLTKYGWYHGISSNTVREIVAELETVLDEEADLAKRK